MEGRGGRVKGMVRGPEQFTLRGNNDSGLALEGLVDQFNNLFVHFLQALWNNRELQVWPVEALCEPVSVAEHIGMTDGEEGGRAQHNNLHNMEVEEGHSHYIPTTHTPLPTTCEA